MDENCGFFAVVWSFCSYGLLVGRVGDRCLVQWLSRRRFASLLEKDLEALSGYTKKQPSSALLGRDRSASTESLSALSDGVGSSPSSSMTCSCHASHRPHSSMWSHPWGHSPGPASSSRRPASLTSSLFLSQKLLTPPFSPCLVCTPPSREEHASSGSHRRQHFAGPDTAAASSRSGRTSSRLAAAVAAAAVASHAVASASPSYTGSLDNPQDRLRRQLEKLFGSYDDAVHVSRVEPAVFAWHWCNGGAGNGTVPDSVVKVGGEECLTKCSSYHSGRETTHALTERTTGTPAGPGAESQLDDGVPPRKGGAAESSTPRDCESEDSCRDRPTGQTSDQDSVKVKALTDEGRTERSEEEYVLPFGVGSWVEVDLGGEHDTGKLFFTAIGIVCQVRMSAPVRMKSRTAETSKLRVSRPSYLPVCFDFGLVRTPPTGGP